MERGLPPECDHQAFGKCPDGRLKWIMRRRPDQSQGTALTAQPLDPVHSEKVEQCCYTSARAIHTTRPRSAAPTGNATGSHAG